MRCVESSCPYLCVAAAHSVRTLRQRGRACRSGAVIRHRCHPSLRPRSLILKQAPGITDQMATGLLRLNLLTPKHTMLESTERGQNCK